MAENEKASYRPAIYYVDDEQHRIAEETIADVGTSGLWPGKVVTEVTRSPDGYTCRFVRPDRKLRSSAQELAH